MDEALRLKLAGILNTLRCVEVRDGDSKNLLKMVACLNELESLIKEGMSSEAGSQQHD